MSPNYRTIDMEHSSRREHFRYFTAMRNPYYPATPKTVQLDKDA